MDEEREKQYAINALNMEPPGAAPAESTGKPALAEREADDPVSLRLDSDGGSDLRAPLAVSVPTPESDSAQAVQSLPAADPSQRPKTDEEVLYKLWKSGAEISATAQFIVWFIVGVCVLIGIINAIEAAKDYFPSGQAPQFSDETMSALAWLHVPGMVQVLQVLPAAVLACVVSSVAVVWVGAKSRSRRIDWTDSHLILEHSGPVALTFRWSAIASVEQQSQWELFHGKQPVFVITTREENRFRLRLSDITYKHNVGEFFSLIKTNAPDALLKVERNFANDNSYTELWLKYFSAPAEREKTGLLDPGMILDNGRYKIISTIGGGGQGTAYFAEINHDAPPAAYDEEPTDRVVAGSDADGVLLYENEAEHWPDDRALNDGAGTPDLSPENISMPGGARRSTELAEHIEMAAASDLAQTKHIMRPRDRELSKLKHIVLKEYILPIHRGHLTAERTADKLKAEAQILQRLHHPQIVGLLDAFTEDYRGYLVLDYVAGDSLKSIVDRSGPQPESIVIDWALQVCSILRYLHGLTPPVVHRDITPDNLLLQADGTIKIVDFNVAYQVDSSATATVVGKHAYIPAEQFRGKPTPQSDIYALGGTMFYLLTGNEPEPITESHPRDVREQLSANLDQVVGRATTHSLVDRFANVDELSDALRALIP